MSNGIVFEVETTRILEILSKEIYDSPLALLRENLQNAYDAVLMRATLDSTPLSEALIEVQLENGRVTIRDSGLGMSEDVLRNNFWKAGSSGKRTDLARRSGVVGTFGIGAMANFGVCTSIRVETRSVGSDETLISTAERANLSIARECITLERVRDGRPPGTTIMATLDVGQNITEQAARAYLEPYVAFVPVRMTLNGTLISQQSYESRLPMGNRQFTEIRLRERERGRFSATFQTLSDPNGLVLVRGTNIKVQGHPVQGDFLLLQNGGQLFGLRSNFGLAPVPNSGCYQLGGYINLSILNPTAGREALSRESIEYATQLISMCETEISEALAEVDVCDRNNAFLQYIVKYGAYNLASRVSVRALPDDQDVQMSQVKRVFDNKELHYYTGRDQSTLSTFAGEKSVLFHISQVNPRRQVQIHYLSLVLKIPSVPDTVRINQTYTGNDLTLEEASAVIRITATITDDYLVPNVEVFLAEISHGVSVVAKKEGEQLRIYLARQHSGLCALVQTYRTAYEVFPGFVKDFVRVHLYPKIQEHVPTSTRQGADALRKILERNRELYRVEESELGKLESVLGDYLSGNISLGEVLRVATRTTSAQTQFVSRDQVGRIEQEMPDVVQSPSADQQPEEGAEYVALPPILRPELSSEMKILTTSEKYPHLHGFSMLLGMSDRVARLEGDFFRGPHTTKVIWAGHRVIYIFTDATGRLSLYYDIELRDPLDEKLTGGGMFPTTTLITKNRIYIPVPDPLIDCFNIVEGPKEFFVRFDTLAGAIQPT